MEARLSRGNQDWDHAEAQAGPRHPADSIRVDLRCLEDGIVVELGVAWQAYHTPVLDQGFHGELCGDDRVRPGHDQAAVQRDAVEDLDGNAALDDQAFDAIKAIQLGTTIGDIGQVPPWRRRGPAQPTAVVQGAAALQDQADGADRGRVGDAAGEQFAVDGGGTELAEVTGVAQLLADGQDDVLQVMLGAVDRSGQAAGAVGPVHAIQSLLTGRCDPALHRTQSNAESVSDLTRGNSLANGFNHLAASFEPVPFLLMAVSSRKVSCHAKRARGTPECLHFSDSRVLALAL